MMRRAILVLKTSCTKSKHDALLGSVGMLDRGVVQYCIVRGCPVYGLLYRNDVRRSEMISGA
jgi:hypothetical protein